MSAPIKREDIKAGDKIRLIATTEFIAPADFDAAEEADDERYELISRPEPVPTEPGWYFDKEGDPWQVADGAAVLNPKWGPYTRIRSEAEVAAEVLAEVSAEFACQVDDGARSKLKDNFDAIVNKWATK